jgi:hypothetical protein
MGYISYIGNPQTYVCSPQKSQKMNEKYAEKPIPNPNEPIKAICGKLDAAHKTNPISKQGKH